MSVLAKPLYSQRFLIAKPPDERKPEAVEKAIEQIPTSPSPVSRQNNQPIESPLPPKESPQPVESTTPTPTPGDSNVTPTQPTPTPTPGGSNVAPTQPTPTTPTRSIPSTPVESPPSPKPVNEGSTTPPPQPTNAQPTSKPRTVEFEQTPNPAPRSSPPVQRPRRQPGSQTSPTLPKQSSFRKANFVDIALGVLAPGDYQSQGRYFHFYQFEGRANQLIQIRLSGSADQRSSNNLSLEPFMFLLDPNNQVLLKRGSEDTSNGGVRDVFMFVRLPVEGTYTIAVTSKKPRDKGRYSLALRNDRASYMLDENDELTPKSLTLRQNGSPYNISTFQGKKDQLISIRVDSLFEEFSPRIVLLNSRGQVIADNNSKEGKYSALIDRARLPEDDTYYVIIVSAIPAERGRYRLTIF